MLGSILNLAKLESKALTFDKSIIGLNGLFDELMVQYKNIVDGNDHLNIDAELPDESVVLYQDSLRIHEMIDYLIDNALKFTDKGSITIGYKPENSGFS